METPFPKCPDPLKPEGDSDAEAGEARPDPPRAQSAPHVPSAAQTLLLAQLTVAAKLQLFGSLFCTPLPLIDSSSFYAFKHFFPQGITFDFGSMFKVFAHVFSQEMYTNTSCQILFQRRRWRDTGATRAVNDINSGGLGFSKWPTCSVHLTFVPRLRAMLYPQLMEK